MNTIKSDFNKEIIKFLAFPYKNNNIDLLGNKNIKMNFFSSLFKSKPKPTPKEEEEVYTDRVDYIQVNFEEDLSRYRGIPLQSDTDIEKIIKQILTFPEIKQLFPRASLENLYLMLLVKDKKTNKDVLRRRVHEFELA